MLMTLAAKSISTYSTFQVINNSNYLTINCIFKNTKLCLTDYRMLKRAALQPKVCFCSQYTAAALPSLQVAWVNLTPMCACTHAHTLKKKKKATDCKNKRFEFVNPAPHRDMHISSPWRNT